MSKKTLISLFFAIVLLAIYNFNTSKEEKETDTVVVKNEHNKYFLPTSTTGQVIHHDTYSLSYSESHEQAEWVAYELKKSQLSKSNYKRPFFQLDKAIKTKSAHWKDYKKSGYTKGHLCPAGDRRYSKSAHNETFLMSNASPQEGSFNGGVWNRLEQKVRYWAGKYDGVFVVTGGVLNKDLNTIGLNKVAIPKQFYKIVIDNSLGEVKMIAFLIPHKNSTMPLYTFVVSVDEIEKLTGIDFFSELEDEVENRLESSSSYKAWSF